MIRYPLGKGQGQHDQETMLLHLFGQSEKEKGGYLAKRVTSSSRRGRFVRSNK